MRIYRCRCQHRVFFDNSQCLACGSELGHCPNCRNVVGLEPLGDGEFECGNPECGVRLRKCGNYSEHQVCNRCVSANLPAGALCDCCRFNDTIPDLSVGPNWEKWRRLEAAKRRLFYDLSELGLPYGQEIDQIDPPLRFDFKADVIPKSSWWRRSESEQRVYTGHANGRITINIREADDVEREKLRVVLGESQRTLIGHFRHEVGHYYWDQLVKGRREDQCRAVFGDHDQPTYSDALEKYYRDGPLPNWSESYISAYATMHPWEDFAETWATYLDMVSGLDTAYYVGLTNESVAKLPELDEMVRRYQELGIGLNELSRSLGLLDFVPEIFVPPVVEKLRYIHQLVQRGRAEYKASQPG
jgi:hypothetical protein